MNALTLDEFEREYARRSGVTVEWLHEHGQYGAPCDCGEEGCKGWKMKTVWQGYAVKDSDEQIALLYLAKFGELPQRIVRTGGGVNAGPLTQEETDEKETLLH